MTSVLQSCSWAYAMSSFDETRNFSNSLQKINMMCNEKHNFVGEIMKDRKSRLKSNVSPAELCIFFKTTVELDLAFL